MAVVNPLVHPQVLFLGFDPDDPRLQRMQALVGSHRVLESSDELDLLRIDDWDVLVAEGANVPSHGLAQLYVLGFACSSLSRSSARPWVVLTCSGRQPSRMLEVSDDLGDAVNRLITEESLPWIETQERVPYIQGQSFNPGPLAPPHDLTDIDPALFKPFVADADGNMVVGAFARNDESGTWCWAVPYRSESPELWLVEAMRAWSDLAPARFPVRDPWRQRQGWMTVSELDASAALNDSREQWAQEMERLRKRELELRAALVAAEAAAEAGDRRLVTTQGDELVRAVTSALVRLGFAVEDADDALVSAGQARAEDLWVTCPSRPDLRIIAEVKGYASGGAKARDLLQLQQHAGRYVQREGVQPDRLWYIVNQFSGGDPDLRQLALAGASDDVGVFASGGGLIIDTRQLFKSVRAVDSGALDAAAVRCALVEQRGRFEAPTVGPVGS